MAGGGQAGIQHFDDHIGAFQPLDEGFFGFVHMAGKPLDAHDVFFLLVSGSLWQGKAT